MKQKYANWTHDHYKFQVAPVILVAVEFVPKCVVNYLKMIAFNEKDLETLIHKLQIKTIAGTVKICNFAIRY